MQGLGEGAGGFGEALGGAAGGGGEGEANLFGFEDFDQGAQRRGFARAGAAGEDGNFGYEGGAHGIALGLGEGETGFFLGPDQGGVEFYGRQTARDDAEALERAGDFLLGTVEDGELEKGSAGQGRGSRERGGGSGE